MGDVLTILFWVFEELVDVSLDDVTIAYNSLLSIWAEHGLRFYASAAPALTILFWVFAHAAGILALMAEAYLTILFWVFERLTSDDAAIITFLALQFSFEYLAYITHSCGYGYALWSYNSLLSICVAVKLVQGPRDAVITALQFSFEYLRARLMALSFWFL